MLKATFLLLGVLGVEGRKTARFQQLGRLLTEGQKGTIAAFSAPKSGPIPCAWIDEDSPGPLLKFRAKKTIESKSS